MFLESPVANAKIKEILSKLKVPDETRDKIYSMLIFLATIINSFVVSIEDITDEDKEKFMRSLLKFLDTAIFLANIEIEEVGYEKLAHKFEFVDKGLTTDGMDPGEFFKDASAVQIEGMQLFGEYMRHCMEKKPGGEFGVPLGFIIRAIGSFSSLEDDE